jgi:transketolase
MRREFVKLMADELADNTNSALILGDIGVFGHRESFELYPDRVMNIGILEQSMVSFAAGMAVSGMVPTIHTIAPFLVERAFEQIKVDFGYQTVAGNFVSVGASIDYAALGATHHCPGDVALMLSIPETEIYVPGTAKEFSRLFKGACRNERISYFRLSEKENKDSIELDFQHGLKLKTGSKLTVLVVGPLLDIVMQASIGMDVTVLYYNSVSPFDSELLLNNMDSGKLLIIEPFYEGTMVAVIQNYLGNRSVIIRSKGIPKKFVTKYGNLEDHYHFMGITPEAFRSEMEKFIGV